MTVAGKVSPPGITELPVVPASILLSIESAEITRTFLVSKSISAAAVLP